MRNELSVAFHITNFVMFAKYPPPLPPPQTMSELPGPCRKGKCQKFLAEKTRFLLLTASLKNSNY